MRSEVLSDLTGKDVTVNSTTTGGAEGIILLEPKYSLYLDPIKYRPKSKKKQAIAIHTLLHEIRHTEQEGYKYPDSENDANHWATDKFRWFCHRKLKFTWEQTMALWNALPAEYRDPKSSVE